MCLDGIVLSLGTVTQGIAGQQSPGVGMSRT